jgi:hypothetical protein
VGPEEEVSRQKRTRTTIAAVNLTQPAREGFRIQLPSRQISSPLSWFIWPSSRTSFWPTAHNRHIQVPASPQLSIPWPSHTSPKAALLIGSPFMALPADNTAYPTGNHQLRWQDYGPQLQGSQQQRLFYRHSQLFVFTRFHGPNVPVKP